LIGAVDIGGTKIAVGIVDDTGRVLARTDSPAQENGAYADALPVIVSMLRDVAGQSGHQLSGIGIGSTGPVDAFTGEYGDVDFLPAWKGKNLPQDLHRVFGVHAAIENDGDAAALGEARWGAGRDKKRLIYITVGTGIGGGIILDGQLYRGVDGAHPEVGHQVIDPHGPACTCGYRGCWESLASGPAMVMWLQGHVDAKYPGRDQLTAERICHLAKEGDPTAGSAVEHEAEYLGLGLANLINLFTPDAIVLGGSVMKSADLFLDGVRSVIQRGCRFVPAEKAELSLASLGEDANLIGAAAVWHHRFGKQITIS
jgi:glucokinase